MNRVFRAGAVLGAVTSLVLAGCTKEGAPRGQDHSTSVSFENPDELDIVERLPTSPPDVRLRYDENPLTFGDLRLPEGDTEGDVPLVIMLHGGAWESDYSLDYMSPLAEALTDAGVATWNIEFRRLSNKGGSYPGIFLVAAHGIDYARQLAKKYPIDLDRVVLMGHSSGGHLATWAAGRQNIPASSEFYTNDPLPVSGVVDLAGVLDLESAYKHGRKDVLKLLAAKDGSDIADKAPIASSINLLPMGVPQTLIIGSKDNTWRLGSQRRYRDAGVEGGDAIDLVELDGANHFDTVDPCSPAWDPIVSAVLEYTGSSATKRDRSLNEGLCRG